MKTLLEKSSPKYARRLYRILLDTAWHDGVYYDNHRVGGVKVTKDGQLQYKYMWSSEWILAKDIDGFTNSCGMVLEASRNP